MHLLRRQMPLGASLLCCPGYLLFHQAVGWITLVFFGHSVSGNLLLRPPPPLTPWSRLLTLKSSWRITHNFSENSSPSFWVLTFVLYFRGRKMFFFAQETFQQLCCVAQNFSNNSMLYNHWTCSIQPASARYGCSKRITTCNIVPSTTTLYNSHHCQAMHVKFR